MGPSTRTGPVSGKAAAISGAGSSTPRTPGGASQPSGRLRWRVPAAVQPVEQLLVVQAEGQALPVLGIALRPLHPVLGDGPGSGPAAPSAPVTAEVPLRCVPTTSTHGPVCR